MLPGKSSASLTQWLLNAEERMAEVMRLTTGQTIGFEQGYQFDVHELRAPSEPRAFRDLTASLRKR